MPIMEKVEKYSVYVGRTTFEANARTLELQLESSGPATVYFTDAPPADWLQFVDGSTLLYLPAADFAHVYHLLQSESPAFFTGIDLFGIMAGAVHTELDLSAGQTPGEDDAHPQSLQALIRRATTMGTDHLAADADHPAPNGAPAGLRTVASGREGHPETRHPQAF